MLETCIFNAPDGDAKDTHQPGPYPLGQFLFKCEDVRTLYSQLRSILKLYLVDEAGGHGDEPGSVQITVCPPQLHQLALRRRP